MILKHHNDDMDKENKFQAVNLSYIRQQKLLFKSINFSLSTGTMLLVKGHNGSGKSSMLRLLTGLSTPTTGDIFWRDYLIQSSRETYWQDLHYVAHANGIKLGLTVLENIQLTHRLSSTLPLPPLLPILEQLQLHLHQHQLASNLSAGQKRRLALAKLFLFPKPLWLLDEPLTALDSSSQIFFLSQLTIHLKQGGIAVISSHHPLDNDNMQTLDLTPSAIEC